MVAFWLQFGCNVFYMWLICDWYVVSMWLLCDCYVVVMWLLCGCYQVVMLLFCGCYVVDMFLLFFLVVMRLLCGCYVVEARRAHDLNAEFIYATDASVHLKKTVCKISGFLCKNTKTLDLNFFLFYLSVLRLCLQEKQYLKSLLQ